MTAECKETTKKYVRLPPPQAVPFTGFDFAKIRSREPVAEQLREFMKRTREAKFFTTGLVIAEWGEGKTDAYGRYIKPEADRGGDYAYLVSTSSIVNKLSRADNLFPYGPPESVTLAACIFYALRDELSLRNEDLSKFPDYQDYKEPSEYIEEVLTEHVGKGKEIVYIFIDEFEEILAHESEIQKKFISGLKELLNGQLKLIHEGGRFSGCLHFILACTPYAYNRIRGDVNLAQIFGALDQRLSSNRIYLPKIGKEEALRFLIDLLKFCYEDLLPQPMPVRSSGILNGIYTISQRNLRSLVQLLSDLLNTAASDGELCVVDYEHFLNTLKDKPISVYGASTQCVDKNLLSKIEFTLKNLRYGEDYVKIFRLLAGELKPFSVEEIQKRIGIEEVAYRINEINQELRNIGISNAITRLNPLKESEKIEEVLESLNPVEGSILLGAARKLPLERFKDETIQYDLDTMGEIHPRMLISADEEALQKALDLYQEDTEYLYRKVSKRFKGIASARHFMLSKALVDQIFPSPLVLQLDFISDRSKRMDLWREAMREFLEMDLELRDGLIEVINREDNFEITTASSNFNLRYTLPSGMPVNIPLAIHSTTSQVTMSDSENLKKLVRRERPGLVLIFHVGEIEENAHAELTAIPNILPIHIRPIRAQQLISLSLARKQKVGLNKGILEERLREILYELRFSQDFNKWLERCRKEGLLIEDLKRPSGKSERDLAQAMTFYVQTIDEELNRHKVFEESEKLQKLTLYGRGKRLSFAPLDIETVETLTEYQRELFLNGFLRVEGETVYILTSPIERRILNNLISRKLSIDEMRRRFIRFAQNERLLEQVYFPILEAKGRIQISKTEILQVDRHRREMWVRQRKERYSDRIKDKGPEWWTYAHICISKERDDRTIILSEFDNYVKELFAKLDSPKVKYDEEFCLRTLRLIDELLAYYQETLEPMITEAWNRGRELFRNAKKKEEEIEAALASILQFYNISSEKKYSKEHLEDYVKLKTSFDVFVTASKEKYTEGEIGEGLELLSRIFEHRRKYEGVPRYFYFKRPSEQASCFNYKVYKMEAAEQAFLSRYEEVKGVLGNITEERNRLHGLGDESKARLLKYSINEQYGISSNLHQALLKYQKTPVKPLLFKTLTLTNIYDFIRKVRDSQSDFNLRINESLRVLDSLIKHEKTILAAGEEILGITKRAVDFFEEGGELLTGATATFSAVQGIMDTYEKIVADFQESILLKVEIGEINQKASEVDKTLASLIDSVADEQNSLKSVYEKSTILLRKRKESITKFIEVLEEGRIDVVMFSKPFEEVIEQATSDIKELMQGKQTKYTWRQILENLEELKVKLYNQVKSSLTEDQFNILLFLVDESPKQKWFDLLTLRGQLISQFGKSEEEVDAILKSLIGKRLIKQGVSLPI